MKYRNAGIEVNGRTATMWTWNNPKIHLQIENKNTHVRQAPTITVKSPIDHSSSQTYLGVFSQMKSSQHAENQNLI